MSRNIWDVLRVPPPGTVPSMGPGTGPAQADTGSVDTARGGGRVPPIQKPDATGYGGGPDSVQGATPLTPTGEASLAARLAKRMQRYPPGPVHPVPNELYDGVRSREAWRHMVVMTASGTFTPSASGTAVFPVTYDQTAGALTPGMLRLDQFPRGSHADIVLNVFTWASLATGGTGVIEFLFQPQSGGIPVPLGLYNLTVLQDTYEPQYLMDAPVIDPGSNLAGNLLVVSHTVATPTALFWRMGFGVAYILPSQAHEGYIPDTAGNQEAQHKQTNELVTVR